MDDEPRLRGPDVDERLDLEAVAVHPHIGKAMRPEGVVAVAEVGEARPVQPVDERVERVVPQPSRPRDVRARSALGEARSFDEVCARAKSRDEAWDLGRVRGTVGVESDDYVAGARIEAGR